MATVWALAPSARVYRTETAPSTTSIEAGFHTGEGSGLSSGAICAAPSVTVTACWSRWEYAWGAEIQRAAAPASSGM